MSAFDTDRMNAGKGLKLMFTAQMLTIAALVVALLGLWAGASTMIDSGMGPGVPDFRLGSLAMAFALIGGLILLVSAVMSIVGLVKCRKAHTQYLYAIYALVAGILIGALLPDGVLSSVAGTVCNIVQTCFICQATDALAGEGAFKPSGALTWKVYAVTSVISAAGSAISTLEQINVFAFVGFAADLVAAVIFVVFLYRAGKCLVAQACSVFSTPAETNEPLN